MVVAVSDIAAVMLEERDGVMESDGVKCWIRRKR